MTKVQIASMAGYENETYDTAIPLQWAGEVNKLDIEANKFIWHYPKGSNSGRPVPLGDLFIKAIQNGQLIPADCLDNIIEMARDGRYTTEQIKELVKAHCQNF